MPDLSALISRMADELDHYRQLLRDDRREVHPLAVKARAALAQPEPEAVGPTMLRTERQTGPFGEWTALIPCNSPAPAPAGEVGELVAWLRDRAESTSLAHNALRITRAADLLERLAGWKESALAVEREWDANGIATMLGGKLGESQRACIQREVPRLLDQLRELEQRHPAPVPMSERPPGPEDCLDEGWAWFFSPRVGWRQAVLPVSPAFTHWLPATALPLPQGGVER